MTNTLRIVTAQLNFCVGDIPGNTQKIIDAAIEARDHLKADLIVFPELAICGYPPEDLLFRTDFLTASRHALHKIQHAIKGIDLIVGHPQHIEGKLYNTASLIRENRIIAQHHKQCLPNYGVFDEERYFTPGEPKPCTFKIKNTTIGLIICEDLWHREPSRIAKKAGAQLLISINASPFAYDKIKIRERVLAKRAKENKIPILYAHQVGGQDDLVYDGGSMIGDAHGKIQARAPFFTEQLWPVDIALKSTLEILSTQVSDMFSQEAYVYQALVLGVRDYIEKNNFPGVLLGLSGGIDSALTLAIAVDAIGKDRVQAIIMPSRHSSELSLQLAEAQAKQQGVSTKNISIEPTFSAFLTTLASVFKNLPLDKTEENIQARCRGVILMALANKTGKLVLTTSNKSEMSTGYSTLYGDMAGGFAVLKDVSKTWAYRLAHHRNSLGLVIPEEVITRPPTAELAPNQTDQDTLPPYAQLDQILELYVEHDKSVNEIIAEGFDEKTIRRIIGMLTYNEYKRRQSAPGPRITHRAYTRERRYPITSKFKG